MHDVKKLCPFCKVKEVKSHPIFAKRVMMTCGDFNCQKKRKSETFKKWLLKNPEKVLKYANQRKHKYNRKKDMWKKIQEQRAKFNY